MMVKEQHVYTKVGCDSYYAWVTSKLDLERKLRRLW